MKGDIMDVKITARHFKAHETLQTHAVDAIRKLEKYYDGIIGVELILSYEKPSQSIKAAELLVQVHGSLLKAMEKSEEFTKSIDAAVAKIERQLQKYKSKQREKKKIEIRRTREKV